MGKGVSFFSVILFVALASANAHAHSMAVQGGISWLIEAQAPDGSWRPCIADSLPCTATVLEALGVLDQQDLPSYETALSWLENQSPKITDYVARRLHILGKPSDMDRIVVYQNKWTGGWGGFLDYGSNPMDTALALVALKTVDFQDQSVLQPALSYLLSTQSSDGGWGSYEGAFSNITMTAMAAITLQGYSRSSEMTVAIRKADDYLIGRQNPDGGFGETHYETALALTVLLPELQERHLVSESIQALKRAQLPNGSWDNDPYTTALALRALHYVEHPPVNPDLGSIQGQVVDGQTGLPLSGVTVTLAGAQARTLTTASTGIFLFEKISEGGYHLELTLPDYATLTTSITLDKGQRLDLGKLLMVREEGALTGLIVGTVRDAVTQEPIQGALIIASTTTASAATSTDGTYQLSNVAPGEITLSAQKEGYAVVTSTASLVAGGVLVFSPSLVPASEASTRVEGTVTDGLTGEPLAGVGITLSGAGSASAMTDGSGSYRMENLPPGEVAITAYLPGYDEVRAVALLSENTVVQFSPSLYPKAQSPPEANTSGVTGLVVNAATGLPLEGVGVTLSHEGGTDIVQTGPEGRFTFTGLTVAEVGLAFACMGYVDVSFSMPLEPLKTMDMGQVRLRPREVLELLPDLVVEDMNKENIAVDPQSLELSGSVALTLANRGTAPAQGEIEALAFHDVNFSKTYDGSVDNVLGRSFYIHQLGVDETAQVSLALEGVLPFTDAPITVLVDSGMRVVEVDEENNTKSTASLCRRDPVVVGDWDLRIKWHWSGSDLQPDSNQVISTPAVAQLDDDNGDGVVDSWDTPDVIFTTSRNCSRSRGGLLRAVSGEDGSEIWPPKRRWCMPLFGPAVGDIDDDGLAEVVVVGPSYQGLKAYEHDGSLKWEAAVRGGTHPTLADLEGDGAVEIIYGRRVYNADGELRWGLPLKRDYEEDSAPLVLDLDLDGSMEIVSWGIAYDKDGAVKWDCGIKGLHGAAGNFDEDDYPELAFVRGSSVVLLEHTGKVKWGPVSVPGGRGGPLTIADVDGDGQAEVGIAGRRYYTVFETDGSIKWSSPTRERTSGRTGSSVFDFEGDGRAEILYGDEKRFRIYDGETGATLKSMVNTSATVFEYPLVVDVDNDGHAEIVVVSNECLFSGSRGVRVLESTNDDLAPTRSIWNQHAYHINNVNDDGTIPRCEEPSWLAHNTYRLNTFTDRHALDSSDLTASLLKITDNGAGEPLTLEVRVGNAGLLPSPEGAAVSFYKGHPQSGGMLLGTAIMHSIQAGRSIDVQLDGVSGSPDSAELYALVDAADSVMECNEANNMIHTPFEAHLPPGRIDVSTDAPNYGSNTSVSLQADITNTGLLGAAYSVELLIRDADGAPVVRFPRQDTGKIAGGGRTSVTQHWSTETVLAGSYRVVAILRSPDGAFVDESQSLFEVLGSDEQGLGVSISATTDKALYHTTDTVRIRALLQNHTQNALLDDVRVLVQVSDPKGTRVFNQEVLLSQLPPGARCDRTFPYSYEGSRPGTHTVTVRVLDGKGHELTSDVTSFEIAEDFTVSLNAELEVKPRELFVNNPLTYTSPVTNGGVAPMDDLGVRVVLVNIENKEEVASVYHNIRVDAGVCRTLTGSFDTRGFEPGPYGCVTQAKVNDKWVTLAHAVFEMKEPTAGSIAPEIALRHGTMNILDGGGPVDFGHTASKLPVDKTFTVTNEGGEALTLSRLVSVPQGFSVRSPFSSTSLPPTKEAEFILRLDARRPGDFGGQVSFESNDPDENPFNFKIRGKVTAQVTNVSVDGKTVPDGTGRVTFESPELGNPVRRTFTVQNMTTRDVSLSDPSLPPLFTFVGAFPDMVPAGGRVTFEVQFDAGRWGVTGGILSFLINGDASNPYEFMVVGVVCGNICDAPGEGIYILPDTCFVDAGVLAGTGGMARILGVVAAKKPDAKGPVESTAVLTPAPDTTCDAFAWTVYDWSGEDITAEAGRSFLNGRCYGFSLLNAPGYYYVEARCAELLDELHAFGLMILP